MTLDELKIVVLQKLAAKFPVETPLIELARTIEEADLCKVDYVLTLMKEENLISSVEDEYKIEKPGQALLYEPIKES